MLRPAQLVTVVAIAEIWINVLSAQGPSVYQQAVAALQRGDARNAIAMLEPFLVQQPNDARALTLLGMALTASGRPAEANQRFEQVLRANPRFAPALRNLALNQMSLGHAREAQASFERLLELTPADPVAHLALAEIYFAGKRYADSLTHFEQSGDLCFQDSRNVLKFAEACYRNQKADRAAAVLERVARNTDPALHFHAGMLSVQFGEYELAARSFERAAAGHPDPYLVGYNLALARLKAKQYAAAIESAERLINSGHRKAELFNLLAHAYESSGRTKEAYESLRTATRIDPADETNYLDLISICVEHKNLDLALEITGIGIKRLPRSDRLRVQHGVVLATRGQFPEAKAAFEEAARLAPEKGLPQISLGLVLLQMDKAADAVEVLRKAAAGAPQDYLVHWFLGEALNRFGLEPNSMEEKEAADALTKSVKLKPDQVQARVLLAKILARRGELKIAQQQLEKALELDPDDVAATYQLAQVLSRTGDIKRSKELFAIVSKAKAEERDQFTRRGLQLIVREGTR